MAVTQHTGTDMAVSVAPGTALVTTGTYPTSYSYEVAIDTSGGETVTIGTAPTSNSRIDVIVAYVDTAVSANTSPVNNADNIFKLAAVAGTAAASPSAPNAAAIQAAIGAANPYIILAQVLVGTNVTQITNSNVTDKRTYATLGQNNIGAGAVTPDKRSGGFAIGIISGATLGSTGIKTITGLGFIPKIVRFSVIPSASNTTALTGIGAMTATNQYYVATSVQASASRNASTSACIGWLTAGSSTPTLLASYQSMEADGFKINVTTANSAFDVAYEAWA